VVALLFLKFESGLALVGVGVAISAASYLFVRLVLRPGWVYPGFSYETGSGIPEAYAIPDMIAEREARIARLKGLRS
jgi:hypothetical protein